MYVYRLGNQTIAHLQCSMNFEQIVIFKLYILTKRPLSLQIIACVATNESLLV